MANTRLTENLDDRARTQELYGGHGTAYELTAKICGIGGSIRKHMITLA